MAAIAANPGNPFVATVDVALVAPAASVLPAAAVVVSVSATTGTSEGVHGGFAVQSATLSLRRVAVDTYDYDAAGRMTSRTVDSVTTALGWDVLSNLTSTSSTSSLADSRIYAYDASGQRVAQIVVNAVADDPVASKVTAYIGDLEVTDADVATTGVGVSATRFLTFGGATVATVTTGSPTPTWSLMLGDGQGSAQVAMQLVLQAAGTGLVAASASHTVTRNAYMPFGATRGTDQLATSRGWLGQVADTDTGLIYLNARYYDPVLARFVSPDPLMNPGDPKTLDPYRYADNNPVMMTDASGLEPKCDQWTSSRDDCYASFKYQGGSADYKASIDRLRPNKKLPMPVGCRGGGLCRSITYANKFLGVGPGLTPAGLDRVATNTDRCSRDTSTCIHPYLQRMSKEASDRVGLAMLTIGLSLLGLKGLGPEAGAAAREAQYEASIVAARSSAGGGAKMATLDWSIVSKTGETRLSHVALHESGNAAKLAHGVFLGDSQAVTNEAWAIAQMRGVPAIQEGGVDIYRVSMGRNVGFAGGANASELAGVPHRTIEIITRVGTNELITAYPVPLG